MKYLRYRALFAQLSLLSRIFLATAIALLVALVLMLQTSAKQDANDARLALERQLVDDLEILPVTLSETIVTGDYATIRQVLTRYVERENLIMLKYQSATGKEISVESRAEQMVSPNWFSSWMGLQDLHQEASVIIGGRSYGKVTIQLSSKKLINQSWSRFKNSLVVMSLAVLLDFVGIWLVLKTGLASLQALQQGANRLAKGDLEARLIPRGSPELRRSMESFNVMASSIARAQGQLSLEAERLHVTLASIADGVISTDEAGHIVFMNPVAETLTGWTLNEVKGRLITEVVLLLNEQSRARVNSTVDVVLSGYSDRVNDDSALLLARDGREIPISDVSSAIRHANGRVSGAVLVLRDQTVARTKETQLKELNLSLEERVLKRTADLHDVNVNLQLNIENLHKATNQLIQSEKMASLGSLVAGISHEVNTPLGISVTSASSIQEEVAKLKVEFESGSMKRSTLEAFVEHVSLASQILMSNLQRASALIRSFKQVAVDQTSEEKRSINLRDYVAEILSSLHPRIKHTAVQVENNCNANLDFYTDPSAFYQIISNLVINAITHAYDEGQPGFIRITAYRVVSNIVFEFEDDGKGIAEQDLKQIFDPFFTTKRGQGGSGLGLNIVYNLVKSSLNGSVEVESKLGYGTKFRMVFPMNVEGAQA